MSSNRVIDNGNLELPLMMCTMRALSLPCINIGGYEAIYISSSN